MSLPIIEEMRRAVLLVGLLQGLFLTAALLRIKSANRSVHYSLAGLVFMFSLVICNEYLVMTGWIYFVLYFYYFAISTPLLFGPLLFFYAALLTGRKESFSKKDWLHFLPFLSLVSYFSLLFILNSISREPSHPTGEMPLYVSVVGSIKGIHMFAYAMIVFQHLKRFPS